MSTFFRSWIVTFTFVLNESTTDAALPVQLIRTDPKHRAGCANPNRAKTLAPAPSPRPIIYLTCKKSRTVTKSSPSVFKDGKLNLNWNEIDLFNENRIDALCKISANNYESGSVSALSACPGTSIWMKHDLSFISVIQGEFTNSWNDVSIIHKQKHVRKKRAHPTYLLLFACTRPMSKTLDHSHNFAIRLGMWIFCLVLFHPPPFGRLKAKFFMENIMKLSMWLLSGQFFFCQYISIWMMLTVLWSLFE